MPLKNPDTNPQELPHEDWQQLAHDAREEWNLDHPGVAALYENHVVPQLHSKGLGHLALASEDKAGGRFLHKYGAVEQQEVDQVVGYLRSNGETIPDKLGDRTAAYLSFMANTVNDGILTGDPESVTRQIDAHVIKSEDMPESYFALQRRIAREQGHGDIEVTHDMKRQLTEAAQADQRGSLDKWVEYLGGEDGSYPDWFKRYTWDSVTKLGAYDKEKAKFDRRTTSTVAPYPELNREALAYAYDTVKKFHVLDESVDDAKLKQILKEGSFGRLYAHAIGEITPDSPEARNEIRGSWTKFNQTNDPRTARRLSGSLQSHGTGWCTAGESTAEAQLNEGDFYVYYTRDEDGKDTIPRIAIRMEMGEVAEVRGVLPSQELEPIMTDIASEQLETLPGGEEYIKKAKDMKRITALDTLLSKDPNATLTIEDVVFIYELNHKIEGFGYDDDPRIKELQLKAANAATADALEELLPDTEITLQVRGQVRVTQLTELASQQPEVEFSDDDLRYIYGLNGPLTTLDPDMAQAVASAIDYWHSGRDRERLLQLIPESIADQYEAALSATNEVARVLQFDINKHSTAEQFAAKLKEWETHGVYQYLLENIIDNDLQFSLVATPNRLTSYEDVSNIAKNFGHDQPEGSFIYDEIMEQFTAVELSGKLEDQGSVRFSLMPSQWGRQLGSGTIGDQRFQLEDLQRVQPELGLHIPSLVETMTWLYTLRTKGDTLSNDTYNRTLIRHFDLQPKNSHYLTDTPFTSIRFGRLMLGSPNGQPEVGTRIALG